MDQVESLLARPKLYYNIDGVGELGGGVMILSYALLLWFQVHAPAGPAWHQMYTMFIYVGLMCAVIHYGSKAIKTHITYPRTGFVEYRKRDRVRPMILGFCVSALVGAGLFIAVRSHWDFTTPASFIGLAFAAAYAHGIARAVRWKWVVVWAMTLGSFVIAFLPASLLGTLVNDSWVTHPFRTKLVGVFLLTLMLFGTLLLISGGISLWLYLRHTQAPEQEGR